MHRLETNRHNSGFLTHLVEQVEGNICELIGQYEVQILMGFEGMLPPELNITSSSKSWRLVGWVEPMSIPLGVVFECTKFVAVATESSRRFMDRMEVGSSDVLGIVTVVSFS